MNARCLLIALIVVLTTGGLASAQDRAGKNNPDLENKDRPALLMPLYLSFVTLQAADLYTTNRALHAGNREANPFFQHASIGTMAGVKAAATVGVIMVSEKLWKTNRVAS